MSLVTTQAVSHKKETKASASQLQPIKFPFKTERGITSYLRPDRRKPYYFREFIQGKSVVSAFRTKEEIVDYARERMRLRQQQGEDGAAHFTKAEMEAWKIFRLRVGYETDLNEIAECFERHGRSVTRTTVKEAVEKFLSSKIAENISEENLRHQRGRLLYLTQSDLGDKKIASITREDINVWLASLPEKIRATQTKRDYQKNVKAVFNWLLNNGEIKINPMAGLKLPKLLAAERKREPILKPSETKQLFEHNLDSPHAREVLGRLALESFQGMRFSTAARISVGAFDFDLKVIKVGADITKKGFDQTIDNAEEVLWKWLRWSLSEKWVLTPRNYLKLKSDCFIRAKVSHAKNVLRKSFSTHHLAKYGNSGLTAASLHHRGSTAVLESNYRSSSLGKQAALEYFKISPPVS